MIHILEPGLSVLFNRIDVFCFCFFLIYLLLMTFELIRPL